MSQRHLQCLKQSTSSPRRPSPPSCWRCHYSPGLRRSRPGKQICWHHFLYSRCAWTHQAHQSFLLSIPGLYLSLHLVLSSSPLHTSTGLRPLFSHLALSESPVRSCPETTVITYSPAQRPSPCPLYGLRGSTKQPLSN